MERIFNRQRLGFWVRKLLIAYIDRFCRLEISGDIYVTEATRSVNFSIPHTYTNKPWHHNLYIINLFGYENQHLIYLFILGFEERVIRCWIVDSRVRNLFISPGWSYWTTPFQPHHIILSVALFAVKSCLWKITDLSQWCLFSAVVILEWLIKFSINWQGILSSPSVFVGKAWRRIPQTVEKVRPKMENKALIIYITNK